MVFKDETVHQIAVAPYVKAILTALPYIFNSSPMFKDLKTKPTFQIIFTTHDPLSLSDLPNSNVVYVERKDYDSKANIMDYDDVNRPPKTFGANISDLLADSFFVEDSLIGDFVKDKIQEVIKWLNVKKGNEYQSKHNANYYKKLIDLIDEPIVQRKLAEMYDEKMGAKTQLKKIQDKIAKLKKEENKLKENNALPKSK